MNSDVLRSFSHENPENFDILRKIDNFFHPFRVCWGEIFMARNGMGGENFMAPGVACVGGLPSVGVKNVNKSTWSCFDSEAGGCLL